MSTTVVTVTRQAPPSSPLLAISVTSSSNLASSISGDLEQDYTLMPSGTGKMHPIAKENYKTRFHNTQQEMEERRLLLRVQIYKRVLSELNLMWWGQLDSHVQSVLRAGFHSGDQLPNIFALWYIEWEEAHPTHFPLPPSMVHFGPVKKTTHFKPRIFDRNGLESQLSKAVTTAWDTVPEPARDLMLLCWTALNSIRTRRNDIAHPNVKASGARAILQADLGPTFTHLHDDAFHLANFLFDSEDG